MAVGAGEIEEDTANQLKEKEKEYEQLQQAFSSIQQENRELKRRLHSSDITDDADGQ